MRHAIRAATAACLALGLLGCAAGQAQTEARREIALTFDDIPLPDGPFYTGEERAQRLIEGLRQAGVSEAMIFATPGNGAPEVGEARLRAYAAAGHVIANHSFSHPNLNTPEITAETYLANVAQADAILRPLPGFRPWFRFPYLSEGDSVEERDAVRQGLIAMGYAQGYVTADSYDWRIDGHARAARQTGHEMDVDALRDLYVRTIVTNTDYADRLAVAAIGRSPKHVLLLHENDLAAMFITDVVAALEADGWRIVPATEAFADPIASEYPNTLDLGGGLINAMAHASGRRQQINIWNETFTVVDAPFAEQVLGLPAGTPPPSPTASELP